MRATRRNHRLEEFNGRAYLIRQAPTGSGGYWTASDWEGVGFLVSPKDNVGTLRECRRLIQERTSA